MKPAHPLRLTACCAAAVLVACAPRYAPPEPPPPPMPEPVRLAEAEAELAPEPLEPTLPTPEEEEVIRDALDLVDFEAFTMPVHVNEHVLGYIDVFTGRARSRFAQYLTRMGRYDELIQSRIAARGLPPELIYVALIESGFSPVAVSHANAVGLWQFIAGTGRMEGLEIDEFIDERRDPVRATDAALQHLQRLYDRFGSWYLAAAAYNAGSGRIQRALDAGADGRTGSDSLFWQIRPLLPAETRNYVPQLIAAAIIGTHPHVFGFESVAPAEPLSFDTAIIPDATEFAVIAEAARLEPRVIAEYNTMFTRQMTPPGRRVEIRLPVGRGEAFARAYAAIPPDQRVRTHVHIVASGETLSGIARRYRTTVAAIQAANRIARPDMIRVGTRLIVPTAAAASLAAASAAAAPPQAAAPAAARSGSSGNGGQAAASSAAPAGATVRADTYTVRPGDTLSGIARRHGLTLAQLTGLNGLQASATIRPGQTLSVRVVTVHEVRAGDTLSAIARRYGVSTRELIEWNALESDVIRPGDQIEVR